jgi:hypothetical protein
LQHLGDYQRLHSSSASRFTAGAASRNLPMIGYDQPFVESARDLAQVAARRSGQPVWATLR